MELPARAHQRERNGSVSKKDQMNISGWEEMTNRGSEEPARAGVGGSGEALAKGCFWLLILVLQPGAFLPWVVWRQ